MDITRKLSMRRLQIIRQNYVISSLYKVISEILLKTRKYTNCPYENQSPKCYITKSNTYICTILISSIFNTFRWYKIIKKKLSGNFLDLSPFWIYRFQRICRVYSIINVISWPLWPIYWKSFAMHKSIFCNADSKSVCYWLLTQNQNILFWSMVFWSLLVFWQLQMNMEKFEHWLLLQLKPMLNLKQHYFWWSSHLSFMDIKCHHFSLLTTWVIKVFWSDAFLHWQLVLFLLTNMQNFHY